MLFPALLTRPVVCRALHHTLQRTSTERKSDTARSRLVAHWRREAAALRSVALSPRFSRVDTGTITDPSGVTNDEEIVRVFEVKHNDAAEPDPQEDFLALVLLGCVGGLLGLAGCTTLGWFCVRRRQLKRIQQAEEDAHAEMALAGRLPPPPAGFGAAFKVLENLPMLTLEEAQPPAASLLSLGARPEHDSVVLQAVEELKSGEV